MSAFSCILAVTLLLASVKSKRTTNDNSIESIYHLQSYPLFNCIWLTDFKLQAHFEMLLLIHDATVYSFLCVDQTTDIDQATADLGKLSMEPSHSNVGCNLQLGK